MFSKIKLFTLVTVAATFAVLIVSIKDPIIAGQQDGLLKALNQIGFAPTAQTGQTTCYDTSGVPGDCTNTGQDGDLRMGIPWPEPRFTDNEDGTITDNLTGLLFMENANCFGSRTWSEALSDCNTLEDGQCGLTDGSSAGDWYLPNVRELYSLVDLGRYSPALPADHPFINVVFDFYWSSTTFAAEPYTVQAWRTCLHCGHSQPDWKTDHHYVWCVRGGK